MKSKAVFPKRGETWLVNFNPARGSEQKGIRPALVVQNDVGNEYSSTTIVAAISSSIKIFPVTVFLKKGSAGLNLDSIVNLAQILTVDKTRLKKKLGELNPAQLANVDQALRVSLGTE